MKRETKTMQLITKLIRETAKGEIKWSVEDVPRSLNQATEREVPLYLETEYKGKLLGIYDVRSKNFFDEHAFYWNESIGFCIVDSDRRVVWELDEYFPALLDLFNTAREQASGVNDIIDDLLGE